MNIPTTAPIVGMHFRPPAKDVLNLLPGGTELLLLREPDNAHDFSAIKVLVPGFSPDGKHADIYEGCLAQAMADEHGALPWNKDSLTDPLHVGYVDSTKTGRAVEWSIELDQMDTMMWEGKLTFSLDGKPVVEVKWPAPVARNEEEEEAKDKQAKLDQHI